MSKPEEIARKKLIDPAIAKAGWNLSDKTQVDIEIPVDGHDAEPWNGVTDYVLLRENGEVLAVVEAKKTTHEARLPQQQTEHYITEIAKLPTQSFRPFAFMTNGIDIYFWDSLVAAPRLVRGFFSRGDLERLLHLRQSQTRLSDTPVNTGIVNRDYQLEGVRRICEAFEDQGRRKSLLVMATGTGKTRTAMAIIDLFIRANHARNILFVADRDALVEQAIEDGFEKYIPSEPCERITSGNIEDVKTNRLFAVTIQTLSNVLEQFTPGFFDLIIFDEVHRSIFNKWDNVLDYFDGRMIGLTATPAGFIDRNTFLKFDCFDDMPTFLYTYEKAIEDGHLVDYRVYQAETNFQREGIRGYQLSEEDRNLLIEQGYDPDDIDFEGTELEKRVTNRDTLRRQWQEIMDVCYKDESGQMPGKTIVFAVTQDHAVRLCTAFEAMYPQWPNMARVITSKSEYRGQSIDNFKKQEMPRIAVSVNMLETGVDVPEVVNLVFMTPVESRIKMTQMIGRGTRNQDTCSFLHRLPEGRKTGFLIIDFWENDFGRQAGDAPTAILPVMVSLFNTRLKLIEGYLKNQQSDEFKKLVGSLRGMIAKIPLESYSVQRVYRHPDIGEAWVDEFWRYLTPAKTTLLRNSIGPLLRYVPGVDVAETTFTHKVERLKLQIQERKDTNTLISDIVGDVMRLPSFVLDNPRRKAAVTLIEAGRITNASPADLDELAEALADQMQYKRADPNPILELDLRDYITRRGYVVINRTGEQVYIEIYRQRVEGQIVQLVATHPTLVAIQHGESVTDDQLIQVERTLRRELSGEPLELTDTNLRLAYGSRTMSLLALLRQVLELDPAVMPDYQVIVERQFDAYLATHQVEYNANQLNFLRAVKAVLARHRKLERNDLYDDPAFRAFGDEAVARLFTNDQIEEILNFAAALAA